MRIKSQPVRETGSSPLLLLAQGLNHESIAGRMGIAFNTAVYHIRQLYSKLDVHTRDEAIACVLAAGETNATG